MNIIWRNDYEQIGAWFRGEKFNWCYFTPISIYFERDYVGAGWEFEFMILGLGFSIYASFGEPNERGKEIAEEAKKLMAILKRGEEPEGYTKLSDLLDNSE